MSAAGMIEQERLGVYKLFIYYPREYIWNNNDSGTVVSLIIADTKTKKKILIILKMSSCRN